MKILIAFCVIYTFWSILMKVYKLYKKPYRKIVRGPLAGMGYDVTIYNYKHTKDLLHIVRITHRLISDKKNKVENN